MNFFTFHTSACSSLRHTAYVSHTSNVFIVPAFFYATEPCHHQLTPSSSASETVSAKTVPSDTISHAQNHRLCCHVLSDSASHMLTPGHSAQAKLSLVTCQHACSSMLHIWIVAGRYYKSNKLLRFCLVIWSATVLLQQLVEKRLLCSNSGCCLMDRFLCKLTIAVNRLKWHATNCDQL